MASQDSLTSYERFIAPQDNIGQPYARTYQEFIATHSRPEYKIGSVQLKALETMFSDPSVSVSEVVEAMVVPWVSAVERNEDPFPGNSGLRFWINIADAIRQLTEFNSKLAELVFELQKHPGEWLYKTNWWHVWREFGYEGYFDPPATYTGRAAIRQGWINMTAFMARLSILGDPELDLRGSAGPDFLVTLEETPWEDDQTETREQYKDNPVELAYALHRYYSISQLDALVPALAMWIRINCKGIYEMTGTMTGDTDHRVLLWKGTKGWSKERFNFWRQRFEAISQISELEQKTRDDAKEAAILMTKVQEEN